MELRRAGISGPRQVWQIVYRIVLTGFAYLCKCIKAGKTRNWRRRRFSSQFRKGGNGARIILFNHTVKLYGIGQGLHIHLRGRKRRLGLCLQYHIIPFLWIDFGNAGAIGEMIIAPNPPGQLLSNTVIAICQCKIADELRQIIYIGVTVAQKAPWFFVFCALIDRDTKGKTILLPRRVFILYITVFVLSFRSISLR